MHPRPAPPKRYILWFGHYMYSIQTKRPGRSLNKIFFKPSPMPACRSGLRIQILSTARLWVDRTHLSPAHLGIISLPVSPCWISEISIWTASTTDGPWTDYLKNYEILAIQSTLPIYVECLISFIARTVGPVKSADWITGAWCPTCPIRETQVNDMLVQHKLKVSSGLGQRRTWILSQ